RTRTGLPCGSKLSSGGRKGSITATSPSVSYRTTGTSSGQSSAGSQSGCGANHQESSLTLGDYAGGTERGRRSADRRDREPNPPKPRDHVLLLAACGGMREAKRHGRELVHVRDVGLATGGPDDPRRGPARAARAETRARSPAAASVRNARPLVSAPRPLPARDAARAPYE